MSDNVKAAIQGMVQSEKVVLFMKGNRSFPQCGFSATVVQILDGFLPSYRTVNVLDDPAIRQGIKDFSNWPTVPQLYIDGEFVGGCDIVKEMYGSGDLQKVLGVELKDVPVPKVTITDSAAKELTAAIEEAEPGEVIHVQISAGFEHSSSLGPEEPGMLKAGSNGISLLFNRSSASRADGLHLDFHTGDDGEGFKIENPNAPPKVQEISPTALKAKLDAGEIKNFYDVRTPEENAAAKIPQARFLDETASKELEALPKDTAIAFHCRSGKRSLKAAEHYRKQGFTKLFNLTGGIHAWSDDIDSSIPKV